MRRLLTLTTFILFVTFPALAHVGVRPRESKPGAEETYTFRVPTEGKVATTSVQIDIPVDVAVLDVSKPDGATVDVEKQGDRIASVTWRKEIKPGESAEFTLRARNPKEGAEIVWKAHQRYTDGTSTGWVGPRGDRRPAPVTRLTSVNAGPVPQARTNEPPNIDAWLNQYYEAFNASSPQSPSSWLAPRSLPAVAQPCCELRHSLL